MDITNFLPGKEKKGKHAEFFWSIVIEPGWIQAGLWKVVDNKAKIIETGTPAAWELEEELISTTDSLLSSIVQSLPEDAKEPSKTVFGVISSWVEKGEIKEEYLNRIKKICTELSLNPVGFVVLPEAIAHLFKSDEGSPLSAVVIGISKDAIELSVFKLGNVVGNTQVARSVSIVDDVTEGLSRFSGQDIPSRFMLHNGKEGEIEEIRQSLLKANWEDYESLKLLHTPKIELINPERKMHAVSLAGAAEMGATAQIVVSAKKEEVKRSPLEKTKSDAQNLSTPQEDVAAEDFGFSINADVAAQEKPLEKPIRREEVQPTKTQETAKKVEETQPQSKEDTTKKKRSLPKVRIPSVNLVKKFSPRSKIASLLARRALVVGLVALLLLFAGIFSAWWFIPKASVTIYLTTKGLDEIITLTIDPEADSENFDQKVIPGETIEVSVSGEKTKSTSGTKLVGEKAVGEVTIYRVGPSLSLAKGTAIEGPNSLSFVLDDDITVASGSAGSAGKTNAEVTAGDLGAQYNLAGGTNFTISNYSTSDMEAVSDSSFSGGSSQEINVISADDQLSLEEDLLKELEDNAKKELDQTLSSDQFLIEESLEATPSSKTFSGKVGDEAETLKLSMDLDTKTLIVGKNNLTGLAKEVLKDKIPDGFVLRDEQIDIQFEVVDRTGNKYELEADVKVNLLPQINPETVAKKISGKHPTIAESYLVKEIPGFSHAEIVLKPKLPGRLGSLPHLVKNINVEITAER